MLQWKLRCLHHSQDGPPYSNYNPIPFVNGKPIRTCVFAEAEFFRFIFLCFGQEWTAGLLSG